MEPDERYRMLHFSEAEMVDEQAVIEFWEREGAVRGEAARERVHEVAFVAVDESGRLAGLSTLYVGRSPQLRAEMWNYRTFVARDHRRSALGILLLRATRRHLEQRFVSGVDTRAPGIIFELENPEVSAIAGSAGRVGVRRRGRGGGHRAAWVVPSA